MSKINETVIVTIILIAIILSACSENAKKTQLSESELVKEYLNHIAVKNIDEYIVANKDSLKYVTGYGKDYLNETIIYLNQEKDIFNEFYNEFGIKCKEIDTIGACEKAQQRFLDTFNSAFKRDVSIITVEVKEKGKSVHTEREEITSNKNETVMHDYLLKKEDG